MKRSLNPFEEIGPLYTDDRQLIAVTGPDGCGVGGVLTADTANYSDIFAEGIITPPGEGLGR